MVILAAASLVCWTIIFDKLWRVARVRLEARAIEAAVAEGAPLDDLRTPINAGIRDAALREWDDADEDETRGERRTRIERAMRAALAQDLRRLERGLPFLATVGSTAPFVGLFGTVWGIVNSFASIAQRQDTSLSVVAPGIAEALFATALGLVAAIPAVMAYNKFATDLGRLSQRFGAAIAEIGNRLARTRPDGERRTDGRREAAE
jgi:biopolymer transport protein ExbB/TolQ